MQGEWIYKDCPLHIHGWVSIECCQHFYCGYVPMLAACRLGEVCSHVEAVLFKVEAACRLGYNRPSCSSQPCQWNQSFRTKVRTLTRLNSMYTLKLPLSGHLGTDQCPRNSDMPVTQNTHHMCLYIPPDELLLTQAFFTTPPLTNNVTTQMLTYAYLLLTEDIRARAHENCRLIKQRLNTIMGVTLDAHGQWFFK